MSKVNIFVSFDVDHDADLYDLLLEQSANTSLGFEVSGRSGASTLKDPESAALRRRAVAHSWLSASQVRERFPGIEPRPGERMLFQPDSGVCLAAPAVAALQRLEVVKDAGHSPYFEQPAAFNRLPVRLPVWSPEWRCSIRSRRYSFSP